MSAYLYTIYMSPGVGVCVGIWVCVYTAYTGLWGLLWGSVYCHTNHMQGCEASSVGLDMPQTAYPELWGRLFVLLPLTETNPERCFHIFDRDGRKEGSRE